MATEKKKKKRQGIVQRMMFGDENKPDLTPERMQLSKWQMFKYLFFHRFGTMSALSLLTAIFAIPAVAVVVIFYLNSQISNGLLPYSSNLGFGYPVVVDAVAQGALVSFTYRTMEFLILVPCFAVFALGVAGNLYVMRKLIWEEPASTVKDFFRGIKKCWLPAVIMGFAFGFTLLLFVFSLSYFDVYHLSVSLKVVCIILASILLVFMALFISFFLTQNAAFKMRPMVLVRNSILFVLGTNVQAIFFIGLAVSPMLLALIPSVMVIVALVYLFIGISFTTLVISLFCHHCYEKYLYDKITDKPSASYSKRQSEIEEKRQEEAVKAKKKTAPTPYKNPKKRKKSIDEGATLTPLTPTFTRADLERLEKEHQAIIKERSEDADDDIDLNADLGELEDSDDVADNVNIESSVAPSAENADGGNSADSDDIVAITGTKSAAELDTATAESGVQSVDGARSKNSGKKKNGVNNSDV